MVLTARRCLPCADGGQVFRADFIHCDKFKTHAGFVASATTWKAWKHIWVKWAKLTILPRLIRLIQLQLVVKEEDTTQLQVPLTGVDQELFLVYLDFKTLQETFFIYVFLTKFCGLYSCISPTAFLVFLCNCILLGSEWIVRIMIVFFSWVQKEKQWDAVLQTLRQWGHLNEHFGF